jgi:hypothetical protein
MEWNPMLPFPVTLIYQVAFLTALDATASLVLFAGYLFAKRKFQGNELMSGMVVAIPVLAVTETTLMILGATLTQRFNFGPIRVSCMFTALVLMIWMARRAEPTRRLG